MEKLGFIPEVYYDAIARVAPGALALVAILWGSPPLPPVVANGAVLLPVGLLTSYIAGLLLETLSGITLGPIVRHGARWYGRRFNKPVWRVELWETIRQEQSDRRAALLVKLAAERNSCRSLLVGFALMWAFQLEPVVGLGWPAKLAFLVLLFVSWRHFDWVARHEAMRAP